LKERRSLYTGFFYPASRNKIKELFDFFTDDKVNICNSINKRMGLIVPHAGYMYCAKTALNAYKSVFSETKIKRVIIMGPDHNNMAKPISVYGGGPWITPMGKVEIDYDFVKFLIGNEGFYEDSNGHIKEHSIEVQLPYLQYFMEDNFKIVPIIIGNQSFGNIMKISEILEKNTEKGDLIIASTDLNHYENQKITHEKDYKIIEAVRRRDSNKLYEIIEQDKISMCGYGAVSVLLNMNFSDVSVISHSTSAEVNGNFSSVVGYMSALFN